VLKKLHFFLKIAKKLLNLNLVGTAERKAGLNKHISCARLSFLSEQHKNVTRRSFFEMTRRKRT